MSRPPPPLVLLHAFGASGRSWAPLSRRLEGVELQAPDLPGFGGAPALPNPSVDAYADWVETFVARTGLEAATLVGWSMGGKVALALAARRPGWLRGLALLAPSPPQPEPMDENDRVAQLAGHGDAALARRSIEGIVVADPPAAWIDDAVADRLRTDLDAWRWWLESGSRETLQLEAPPVPTLIVVGARDPNLGEGVQRALTFPALVDPQSAVIEGCGHFLPIEAPDALARTLSTWATTLPETTPAFQSKGEWWSRGPSN